MPSNSEQILQSAMRLKTLDFYFGHLPSPTKLLYVTASTEWGLTGLFAAIERLTGLEVCLYPPNATEDIPSIKGLPVRYRRHMSGFCQAAKNTLDHGGCRGHDAIYVNQKAAELKHPFVQICHAGAAEAVVPIIRENRHLGTVFIGQAVTPAIASDGASQIDIRNQKRVRDLPVLQANFKLLPSWTEEQLMELAMLVDAAIRGLAEQMDHESLDQEVRLQHAPAIRRALDIVRRERCWSITAAELASRVYLSSAYFSRLFRQIIGKTFSEYITDRRIAEAQNLLHKTSLPVSDIALRCGFSRQSYFTRRFRQKTGLTPSAFRDKSPKHDQPNSDPRRITDQSPTPLNDTKVHIRRHLKG